MKQAILIGGLVTLAAVAAAAKTEQVVWVTTIHRGDNLTIGRTYRDRTKALADASRSGGGDPNIWIIVEPSQYVRGGGR